MPTHAHIHGNGHPPLPATGATPRPSSPDIESRIPRWKTRLREAMRKARAKNTQAADHSTRDALRGGDLAAEGLFDNESPRLFEEFLDDLRKDLSPQGRLEHFCVERMAVAHWRLRRALRAEKGYLIHYATTHEYRMAENGRWGAVHTPAPGEAAFDDARRMVNPAHFPMVERFRENAQREFHAAMETLRKLQRERRMKVARRVREWRRRKQNAETAPKARPGRGHKRDERAASPTSAPATPSTTPTHPETALQETAAFSTLTPSQTKKNIAAVTPEGWPFFIKAARMFFSLFAPPRVAATEPAGARMPSTAQDCSEKSKRLPCFVGKIQTKIVARDAITRNFAVNIR